MTIELPEILSGRHVPGLRGLFITGTDTDVGKTLVAGAIAAELRRRGLRVEVFKPAATGCRRTREGLVSADAEFLAACADSSRMLAEIAPVRYVSALAPNVAAAREHRPVDLDAIFDAYNRLQGQCDCVIVEGVGGLLCPISDEVWVVHLAMLMRLPLVVVARAGLGTINHTLLTLHAARDAALDVAGVVINRYRLDEQTHPRILRGGGPPPAEGRDEDVAILTNPAQIAERGRTQILAIVPEEAASSVADGTIGPDTRFAIAQVEWEELF